MFTLHMGELNTIRLKKSEIRNKLLEIGKSENPDQEATKNLLTELQGLETREAALLAAEGESETTTEATTTPETRELEKLHGEARVGDVVSALVEHRTTTGAMAELQQHHRLEGNQIPISMLLPRDELAEARAAATIPTDVQGNQQAMLNLVFARSVASFLQIPMRSVPVGQAIYPVMTAGAAPGSPAKGVSQAESTAAFTAEALTPKRLQASVRWAREDGALFRGLEDSLRGNLRDAVSDEMDNLILNDTAEGLLVGTNLANNNATAADTFDSYLERFLFDSVDGRWADSISGLRWLVGSDTYKRIGTAKATNTSETVIRFCRGENVMVRVGYHMAAAASNKQNAIVRIGSRPEYVAPVWDAATIIYDETTDAAKGEIILTIVLLWQQKLLRANGFRKVQAQFA